MASVGQRFDLLNCHISLDCMVLHDMVWYFIVLRCIDTLQVILSDWRRKLEEHQSISIINFQNAGTIFSPGFALSPPVDRPGSSRHRGGNSTCVAQWGQLTKNGCAFIFVCLVFILMLHLSLPVGVLGNKRPPVQPLQGSPDVIVPNSVGSVHRGHCQEDFSSTTMSLESIE